MLAPEQRVPGGHHPGPAQHGVPADRTPRNALRWGMSGHARRVLILALTGLVIAIITGRAEFAGVAAPAVLLLATWRRERPQQLQVTVALTASRTVEGERSAVDVTIEGQGEHTVQARLHPARAILPLPGPGGQAPGRGAGSTVRLPFAVTRWGRHHVGTLEIILRDRWRLAEGSIVMTLPRLDCYPRPAAQQTRVVLSRLPNRLGEHPARAPGEGIEFAGVREYVPGDRQRSINWPATTRRGRLQVNTFAAERSQDVVILVDATPDAGEPGQDAADLALRGAAAAARVYLAARDRVGLITYRYQVRWLVPGLGQRQFYRIAEAMLADQGNWSADPGFSRLPRAALPPGALILVFSALLDRRLVETLRDMRERGFAVLIVDVLTAEPGAGRARIGRLARRIWRMEQEAIRFSLRELGIPVVHWDGEQSLDLPLAPYARRPVVTRR
jgi:uncharacterized protein (DUF58 family)